MRRIPWKSLEADGVNPKEVMLEAQRQRLWLLARRAYHRVLNNQKPARVR
jgi:hypothetical protein